MSGKKKICPGRFLHNWLLIPKENIGNMSHSKDRSVLEEMAVTFQKSHKNTPEVIAVDFHPDMFPTILGRRLAQEGNISDSNGCFWCLSWWFLGFLWYGFTRAKHLNLTQSHIHRTLASRHHCKILILKLFVGKQNPLESALLAYSPMRSRKAPVF